MMFFDKVIKIGPVSPWQFRRLAYIAFSKLKDADKVFPLKVLPCLFEGCLLYTSDAADE